MGQRKEPAARKHTISVEPGEWLDALLSLKSYNTASYKPQCMVSLNPDVCVLRVVYTLGERDGFGGDGAGLGT